ncbi:VOC family protein [Kitasatospora arboriphila]
MAGQGVLALFDRAALAAALGTGPSGTGPALGGSDGGGVMFVCRVGDVDAGYALCLRHGAEPVTAPTDRPQWGPGLRTAHLRDPEGTLVELQSY